MQFLEVVSFGEADREFFGVFTADAGPVGPVMATWVQVDDTPYWRLVRDTSVEVFATRDLVLTKTMRLLGVNLKKTVGNVFDYKEFSGDAWSFYLTDGFMI